MKAKKVISTLLFTLILVAAYGQSPGVKIKVIDIKNVSTVVNNASSSSSSSCNSSDFPVYQGASLTDVNFGDLKKIIVRHDKPAEDATNYLTVELVLKNGQSDLYEMVRNIRFTGETEYGDFSVKVKDVKTVEVLEL